MECQDRDFIILCRRPQLIENNKLSTDAYPKSISHSLIPRDRILTNDKTALQTENGRNTESYIFKSPQNQSNAFGW